MAFPLLRTLWIPMIRMQPQLNMASCAIFNYGDSIANEVTQNETQSLHWKLVRQTRLTWIGSVHGMRPRTMPLTKTKRGNFSPNCVQPWWSISRRFHLQQRELGRIFPAWLLPLPYLRHSRNVASTPKVRNVAFSADPRPPPFPPLNARFVALL